jgi:hypothetical protein
MQEEAHEIDIKKSLPFFEVISFPNREGFPFSLLTKPLRRVTLSAKRRTPACNRLPGDQGLRKF